MQFTTILAAAAAATQVHWVPLNSQQAKEDQGQIVPPTPVAQAPTNAPAPVEAESDAPPPVALRPIPSVQPPTPAGVQSALALTCGGAGTADKQRGSFLVGRWGWASMVSHHDRQFKDQVDVRLFSGDDRIRLPRTMVPGIHGGDAGWFKLKDVVADARSIQAHASVSAFHNPKVYIDRTTGTISISGKDGDYSGACEVIDAGAAPKF
jgi:hypothetical protein